MKYLKFFEGYKEDIHSICKKHGIISYTINEDGSIDVYGDVHLFDANRSLTKIPLNFRNVDGSFYCHRNQLTNLKVARSVSGDFYCRDNQLVTLEGDPQYVGGDFDCSNNKLVSLEGAPQNVGGDFYFSGNPCYPIYKDWINGDRRYDLLEMMEDYDFLRSDTIIWDRLESFFKDNGLELPNKEELRKSYKII